MEEKWNNENMDSRELKKKKKTLEKRNLGNEGAVKMRTRNYRTLETSQQVKYKILKVRGLETRVR